MYTGASRVRLENDSFLSGHLTWETSAGLACANSRRAFKSHFTMSRLGRAWSHATCIKRRS